MIGELSENQLHNSLKKYYFQKGDIIEHKLEGYYIDDKGIKVLTKKKR